MADPVAWWGAVTGSVAVAVAVRREVVVSRVRVGIEHRLNMTIDRETLELSGAWLTLRVVNRGGRVVSIERLGVEWIRHWEEGRAIHIDVVPVVAEIALSGAFLELRPNAPSQRVSTPLGPLLAQGVDPFEDDLWSWGHTADGREWRGPPHPIVLPVPPPPGLSWDRVREGFLRLQEEAEAVAPPQLDRKFVVLAPEVPRLIEPDEEAGA
jgi:hypothetical protein